MEKILIYHGSEKIIEKPIFGYGKPYNDYGIGFYCTPDLELAKEWGVDMYHDGIANKYELDMLDLKLLDLNSDEYCDLHWISALLQNRKFFAPSPLALEAKEYILKAFSIDFSAWDVVLGYRADDSYFSFAQDFINGTISYRQLGNALRLGNLGKQYALKSEKAFERIEYLGYETVERGVYLKSKVQRDHCARRDYLSPERNRRQKGDIYITNIMDEEMTVDDLRIR